MQLLPRGVNGYDFLSDNVENNASHTDPRDAYSAIKGTVFSGNPDLDDGEVYAGGVIEEQATVNADTSSDWASPGSNYQGGK